MAGSVEDQNLAQLSAEALIAEEKKRKSAAMLHAFIIGLAVGIAVYSTVKNGFGILTFFPVLFMWSSNRASNKLKIVRAELKARSLETNK